MKGRDCGLLSGGSDERIYREGNSRGDGLQTPSVTAVGYSSECSLMFYGRCH